MWPEQAMGLLSREKGTESAETGAMAGSYDSSTLAQ